MKKLAIAVILIGLLGVAVFAIGGSGVGAANQGTVEPTVSANVVKAPSKIIAEGKVVPAKSAALAFQSGGILVELPVELGDSAESGKLLARLDTRQLELQLAQAEANLASAQAKLAQLKRGPTPEEQAAAQQNLISAQAAYDNLLHPAESDLVALKSEVDKAQAQLDRATAAYDRIGGDSNPFSGMSAERAQLQTAWLDHQKAVSGYNAKLQPTDAQVQQALAAVQTAKNQLAKLQPTAEDLAAAEASAKAAQAARDLAAQQLDAARLLAPFDGQVTSLEFKDGEYVPAGGTVLRLADTGTWRVETTDLTELNIVSVAVGDKATLSFDAIPDLELTGHVTQIKGYGENKQGDIVYTLVIALDQQDARLRWNMTAKVSIDPEQ